MATTISSDAKVDARNAARNPPQTAGSVPTPDEWVDRYGDLLFRYALVHVPQRDAAEDLVQETFLAALVGRERFAGAAKFETWLVSILRNKIRDRLRTTRQNVSLDELTLDVAAQERRGTDVAASLFNQDGFWHTRPGRWADLPDTAAENTEFWATFHQCLAGLPEHLGSAFRVKLTTRDDNQTICETLGVTAANLAVRLHRARLLLRNCLQRTWFDN